MSNNNYSNINSFNDFREEKMRLLYQIRLSEKKLEIKKMELQEFLNPIRLVTVLLNELSKPLLGILKSSIKRFFFGKKKSGKKRKKASDPMSDRSKD
ncbi:hypothetical protein SAMN06265379_101245 [Saccharicrinis carchari]|uniref:Uncharacterized protein n=1 Tax=Saccharicrinis carchari TaxID=1168039 RepID=A0A521AM83_SACCC|nr:hypothetical protein [Saccharicrinis carchari]SMO35916.1 hypothetical protein SAMN06265379_101245 [Saccharicrinis carchari]